MDAIAEILTLDNILFLLKGTGVSLLIALCVIFFASIIGTLGAAAKQSRYKILRGVTQVYVQLIRGTPMMLQILFFYLAGPVIWKAVFGYVITPNPIIVGIIAMSINSGAYSIELIRSAIASIDKGQWEASRALGLSYWKMMRHVILPQAFRRILPPFISEFVTMIKDSSLISTIGGVELLRSAQRLGSQYYDYITPLLAAAAIYLVVTIVITHFATKLERKLGESDA